MMKVSKNGCHLDSETSEPNDTSVPLVFGVSVESSISLAVSTARAERAGRERCRGPLSSGGLELLPMLDTQ